ncbi:hypothetical protein ACET3X_008655 [Alternaria dauci]|uniref:Uncharacterized protein n=1 Tax=Alternaria dauci TaxID=48095 RepID=A0ABR3UB08_9PLEO
MTVATENLAHLRKQLGIQGQALLDYAPYSKIEYASQTYDLRAVSFKLLFGHNTDKYTKKPQDVWILLYPPTKEGGHAEVQFHSLDSDTQHFTKHDDSNISATMTTIANAFKTPKKGSKGKHVALAKYYFLNAIATRSTQMGRQDELSIPIPITRSFVDGLKVACREFEEEAKAHRSDTLSRSQSATLVNDNDSVLSDTPEDVSERAEPITPAVVPASTHGGSNTQLIENLIKLQEEEDRIHRFINERATEIAALEAAREEIEGEFRLLAERSRMSEEEMVKITARREHLLKGMTATEVFKLGREMANKR